MWICFVILVAVLFGLPTYSDQSKFPEQYNREYSASFALQGRADVSVDERMSPAPRSCGTISPKQSKPAQTCGGSAPTEIDCTKVKGCVISSTLANYIYLQCCPRGECLFYTIPCPRTEWTKDDARVQPVNCLKPGYGNLWHIWKNDLEPDTLYDVQVNQFLDGSNQLRAQTEYTEGNKRFHTCVQAIKVMNLRAAAYGLGWIYFKWRRPPENCLVNLKYEEEYTVAGWNEKFNQKDVGDYMPIPDYYEFKKFHPCPEYPNWFCFIISENVAPFKKTEFKVKYERFSAMKDIDKADWDSVTMKTDEKTPIIKFCPARNFLLTIWFLAILIAVFLLLLIVACILIAMLLHRKKKEQRKEDMADEPYEEEPIGPTNMIEKIWERLKNFFNQLCPRPKKPPPPPPPPPPKKPKPPKPRKKAVPKPPKKKKTPSPLPSPSPPPPPPPPPKPKPKPKPIPKRKPRPKEPAAPPPPPPPPKKKAARGPRAAEKKGPDAAMMDTKRAVSAVGGGSGRRRPRR